MTDQPDWTGERPGYRRHIRVQPREDAVLAMLEDDIHCLAVILRHDGHMVLEVEPYTERMPWTTCPAAADKLVETFSGQPLCDVTARREKKQNCTHLHDLAVLAAAHAQDREGFAWTIHASDPQKDERILEIAKNGRVVHRWIEQGGTLVSPEAVAGKTLFVLREWIDSLDGDEKEGARLLQWGSLVAHGRTMPLEEQSRAADLPPNCFTFQPERAVHAQRVGDRFDFSTGNPVPLAGFSARMVALLDHPPR